VLRVREQWDGDSSDQGGELAATAGWCGLGRTVAGDLVLW
jgi:hypothetical protein